MKMQTKSLCYHGNGEKHDRFYFGELFELFSYLYIDGRLVLFFPPFFLSRLSLSLFWDHEFFFRYGEQQVNIINKK